MRKEEARTSYVISLVDIILHSFTCGSNEHFTVCVQCLTDFSNLDGLATGTSDSDDGSDGQLAVSEKLVLNTERKLHT